VDVLNYLRDGQLAYPPDGTDFKYLLELRAEAEVWTGWNGVELHASMGWSGGLGHMAAAAVAWGSRWGGRWGGVVAWRGAGGLALAAPGLWPARPTCPPCRAPAHTNRPNRPNRRAHVQYYGLCGLVALIDRCARCPHPGTKRKKEQIGSS
jgi:hypothetical protein